MTEFFTIQMLNIIIDYISQATSSVDYAALVACYTGEQGYALLGEAAAKFNATFPYSKSVPPVMPTMQVGIVITPEPYASGIEKIICDAGSSAPICKQAPGL